MTRTAPARRRWFRRAALWIGAALLVPSVSWPQSSTSFRVIVNAGNAVTSLPRAEVAKLFLKKTSAWKAGGTVQPVDLREDSEVRRAFSTRVLNKEVSVVKGYWQERIFTGRGVPPIEKASEAEVLAFVSANEGGIGYVSASVPLGPNVKVVRIVD